MSVRTKNKKDETRIKLVLIASIINVSIIALAAILSALLIEKGRAAQEISKTVMNTAAFITGFANAIYMIKVTEWPRWGACLMSLGVSVGLRLVAALITCPTSILSSQSMRVILILMLGAAAALMLTGKHSRHKHR